MANLVKRQAKPDRSHNGNTWPILAEHVQLWAELGQDCETRGKDARIRRHRSDSGRTWLNIGPNSAASGDSQRGQPRARELHVSGMRAERDRQRLAGYGVVPGTAALGKRGQKCLFGQRPHGGHHAQPDDAVLGAAAAFPPSCVVRRLCLFGFPAFGVSASTSLRLEMASRSRLSAGVVGAQH